jgi:hypothetical protein
MKQAIGLDALKYAFAGALEVFNPVLGACVYQQGLGPARTCVSLARFAETAPLVSWIYPTESNRAVVILAALCEHAVAMPHRPQAPAADKAASA